MVIKGDTYTDIEFMGETYNDAMITQDTHIVCIQREQAEQLVKILQKWIKGEDTE